MKDIKEYVVTNPQKVLTLKALVEDIKAIEHVKMLLEERKMGSLEIINELKEEYVEKEGISAIYEVFFNLKTDKRRDMYPNGRNSIDVSEKGYQEMLEDDSFEVIHFNKYQLTDKTIKKLEN